MWMKYDSSADGYLKYTNVIDYNNPGKGNSTFVCLQQIPLTSTFRALVTVFPLLWAIPGPVPRSSLALVAEKQSLKPLINIGAGIPGVSSL